MSYFLFFIYSIVLIISKIIIILIEIVIALSSTQLKTTLDIHVILLLLSKGLLTIAAYLSYCWILKVNIFNLIVTFKFILFKFNIIGLFKFLLLLSLLLINLIYLTWFDFFRNILWLLISLLSLLLFVNFIFLLWYSYFILWICLCKILKIILFLSC